MKKNHGYTLIELIIVLAIMAILAGMSFITLSVVKTARCNAATSTLSNEMGALLVKTKALSEAKSDDKPLCMKIEYNTTAKDVNGLHLKEGSYSLILGFHDDSGSTFEEKKENGNLVLEATLSNLVQIVYTPSEASQKCSISGLTTSNSGDDAYKNDILIEFDKATGAVRYGAGTYEIRYNGSTFATVYLDAATGNHYIK